MKKSKLLICLGLLLIAAALVITGFNIVSDRNAGKASDEALARILPEIAEPSGTNSPAAEKEIPDYVLNPGMDMPAIEIDGEKYVGILNIPAIDRILPIYSEWDYTKLLYAPCRYAGTAYMENMVICAHNYDKHFGQLKNLSYGDDVIFTDADGNEFRYRVAEIVTLDPFAIDDMTAGEWPLTLFTCTIGGAARVTVRCEAVNQNTVITDASRSS